VGLVVGRRRALTLVVGVLRILLGHRLIIGLGLVALAGLVAWLRLSRRLALWVWLVIGLGVLVRGLRFRIRRFVGSRLVVLRVLVLRPVASVITLFGRRLLRIAGLVAVVGLALGRILLAVLILVRLLIRVVGIWLLIVGVRILVRVVRIRFLI